MNKAEATKDILTELVKEAAGINLKVDGDICFNEYFLILNDSKISKDNIDAISHFIKKYDASFYCSDYDKRLQIRIGVFGNEDKFSTTTKSVNGILEL